jgi:thiamine biosynthesis lipoprotein
MGTTWSVSLFAADASASLGNRIEQELERLVAQMSHWGDDSDLARYNRA